MCSAVLLSLEEGNEQRGETDAATVLRGHGCGAFWLWAGCASVPVCVLRVDIGAVREKDFDALHMAWAGGAGGAEGIRVRG